MPAALLVAAGILGAVGTDTELLGDGLLAEPSPTDFFGLPPGGGTTAVERVRDITKDEFDARVRSGRPFIIEDAGRGIPLVGSTCEQFQERYPGARMRAEYAGGGREKFVSLGSESWLHRDRRGRAQEEHISGGSAEVTAPYVWHVKDGGLEAPPEVRAAMQQAWRPPYFLWGAANRREANESGEFWFLRRRGAVLAHADTYCIPAVSLQLHGKKRWRLMPPPPITSTVDRYDAHDGGIYKTGLWKPVFEATVLAGEALVFFPNMFHETFVPEDNPPCTVATTFQFQHPVPVRYLRAYLPTHSMSHLYYEGHCADLWHSFSTLQPPGAVRPTLNESAIAARVAGVFRAADGDGDGRLSVDELEAHLAREEPPWPRWFLTDDYFYDYRPPAEEQAAMGAEVLRNRAEDTVAYLDTDGDGVAASAEMRAALKQWGVVHRRLRELARLRQKEAGRAAVLKAEREYLRKYGGAGRARGSASAADEAAPGERSEL